MEEFNKRNVRQKTNSQKVNKKLKNKLSNLEIKTQFLMIGLVAIITIISLIYFIFLKYSPIMNFKYEGYAVSGKEITENLLGEGNNQNKNSKNSGSVSNEDKNIDLAKIEEQGTIFRKLGKYFIGSKEKTEIDLNYPIYINEKNTIYNLSQYITLISKDFEKVSGYPNISISDGKVYNGNSLERADGKEYIFIRTNEGIYINLKEIKIQTTANEYIIPVNSLIAFEENEIRYYALQNNTLIFKEINDVDYNSQVVIKNIEDNTQSNVQKVNNTYNYEELLTKLEIIENAKNDVENSQEKIEKEETFNEEEQIDEKEEVAEPIKPENKEEIQDNTEFVKPEVTAEEFKAEVYSAKSRLHIKDPSGKIIEAPTFEIYKEGKIYLRRIFKASGEIQITGLVPDTEYEIVGKYIYLNEENKKIENTFFKGTIKTKGYEALGAITLTKEEGEIFSNKIQIKNLKITSDINAEEVKGINQVEIETGEIKTVIKNDKVNELSQGKEVTIESSEGLKSNAKVGYKIRFYDKNGKELKVENNEGKTKTSKQEPKVKITVKEQDIVSVTLGLKLNNKDNVSLNNYKYAIAKSDGEIVREERLSENEKEIKLENLDQNQYYKITIYAEFDLNDNKGIKENIDLGNLVFATKPIATLGALELQVENKETTNKSAKIEYRIDEERTDKRLIQILNELTIKIVKGPKNSEENANENKDNKDAEIKEESRSKAGSTEHKNTGEVVYSNTLAGEEIEKLKLGETKVINYEQLKSNTTYKIEITGNIELGNTKEEVPVTYTYNKFITLKIPAKVEIKNQFVTGNLIDLDVRVKDEDNSVLNNKLRMELRDEKSNLIDLQEIETNKDWLRKTYEKLEENKTYILSFYAEQYNEGSTDETYKINYLIKRIEILTEPGISGNIGLTELTKKATGKNLVDISSEIKWYVYPNFNTNDYYGKEYNEETKILKLGGHGNYRMAVYDLTEYAGQEVTMSFKARTINGDKSAYIQNSKTNTNRTKIEEISTAWKDFSYTLILDSTGYLGFCVTGGGGIEVKELQIELGNKKTSYEEFKYTLQSNYSINLEDKRDEITTNDYYIKLYEDESLIKTDRYEEITEENVIENTIKTYNTQPKKDYKVELVVKIRDREYILSKIEYSTKDTEEIKGIYTKEDFLEIQQRGNYIVLNDIDLSGAKSTQYRFGSSNMPFEGKINFNGHSLTRDAQTNEAIIDVIGKEGSIENLVLNIRLNNEVEISTFKGLARENKGVIENVQINLIESTKVPNMNIALLCWNNYGTINKFVINYEKPLYGMKGLFGIAAYNKEDGIISNGYTTGENIKAVWNNTSGNVLSIVNIAEHNSDRTTIKNVYTLTGIDTESTTTNGYMGHIASEMYRNSKLENVYSVGLGDTYNLGVGPNIWYSERKQIKNSYYFNDEIFTSPYNQKTTKLALWDKSFQNEILNSENAFEVDSLVEKGYYPQIDMPECMPKQKYIKLPEVEDKDLPDILSTKVLENSHNSAKVKFIINNPSGETITNIRVKNLNCKIEQQEYKDGKSEVIVILDDPIICVSKYSVISITTKGAYNKEYTREFKENERTINVDFYREINTTDDWKDINKSTNENYILMQDLDFKNNPKDSNIYSTYKGKLDGNSHTIRNATGREYILVKIENEMKNIKFENIELNTIYNSAGIIGTANKLENVHAKNVTITRNNQNGENGYTGGLVAVAQNTMKNCSINNVTILDNSTCINYRIGGLVGVANSVKMTNCFASNVNMKIKNGTYQGVGGLIGSIEVATDVKNCYAHGRIEIDGNNVGGLIGNWQAGSIENSYSYVDITGNVGNVGGLVGRSAINLETKNTITLGNIYTSKMDTTPKRVLGTRNLKTTNYAYINQRINGLIGDAEENVKLLNAEELLNKNTYINLNYGDAFDYAGLEKGILPQLRKMDENGNYQEELLPNQVDIHLDTSNELKIDSIDIQKSAVDKVEGRIVLINTKEVEVVDLEIDGMDVDITDIANNKGKTYINVKAKPHKFYDTYKISKATYKEQGVTKEQSLEGKIELQFFKEIYNFEDWQNIEKGTNQNYRLMNDIDFTGKTQVNSNVTIGRLEANNGNKTLKNINVEEASLIEKIESEIKNINFENVNIISNNIVSNVGVIATLSGSMNNIYCKNIMIDANNADNVGIVGINFGPIAKVNMENINLSGGNCVGGLVGFSKSTIDDVIANEIKISGNDYIGGIVGKIYADTKNVNVTSAKIKGHNFVGGVIGNVPGTATNFYNLFVNDSEICGDSNVGGTEGCIYGYGSGKRVVYNSNIIGKGRNIGGIIGNNGGGASKSEVINSNIKGIGTKSDYVGGISGNIAQTINDNRVLNSKIETTGDYVGGLTGIIGHISSNMNNNGNYVENITVIGNSKVGGALGYAKNNCTIANNYINAEVIAKENDVGGIVGYIENGTMSAIQNKTIINENYFVGNISGNTNVGGVIGNIEKELYMPDSYYCRNYIEAHIKSESDRNVSLGIGNMQNQNQYLKDTYFYKYSSINGKNPNTENEIFISSDMYVQENDLKQKETYTNKLNWKLKWNYDVIDDNKYPTINREFVDQTGIPLPKDEENIIEENLNKENISAHNIEEENSEKIESEYIFNYNGKIIKTYETYSEIIAEDGSKVVRNDVLLYVKNGKLYALPVMLGSGKDVLKLVANNFVIDLYNGKEYETVLGEDGRLYDLKTPIKYPENFVNEGIASIGNNLDSNDFVQNSSENMMKEELFEEVNENNEHEIEVIYKDGDKIKFNYQTGEVISLTEEKQDKIGLFDYVKDKLSEIGNSNSRELQEIQREYEESKILQSKLEKLPIEVALQEQKLKEYNDNINKTENENKKNSNNSENFENNEANNSLKETRYISIYNTEKDEYQIYQEEELLDTTKQEVVSENDKIEANNLNKYYASEGKSRNKNMGILWITLSIIGVVIILFAIKKRD